MMHTYDYIDPNIELISKIHHDIDHKCNIAIFSDWAIDEDNTLFPNEKTSYDKFINGKEIDKLELHMMNGSKDLYFSINSFRHQKKLEKDVWHLNAFALDFDYYKIDKYKDLSAKDMYEQHIKEKLPLPASAVIDSGRGLYVIYTFKHSCRSMIGTYKAIYNSFMRDFQEFGLDANAMKVTQIIRLPGTINSKTNSFVSVIESNDTDYKIPDFYSCLPYTREEMKERKKARNKKKRSFVEYTHDQLIRSNKFKKEFTATFILDLEKLIDIRNKKGHYEGYREILIYLVRRRMQFKGATMKEEIDMANYINNLFHQPLSDKEVLLVAKPYGKHKCPGISKTMALLEIDQEEEIEMKILCRKSYKDAKRNKGKARHPLFNLTEKQLEKLKRQAEVYKLKKELFSNADIARKLNVTASTITRDLADIKEEAWRWKETMKELFIEFKEYIQTDYFIKQTIYSKQEKTLAWLKACEGILE